MGEAEAGLILMLTFTLVTLVWTVCYDCPAQK